MFAEIESLESNAYRLELQIEPLTLAANDEAAAVIVAKAEADALAADKIRERMVSRLEALHKLTDEFIAELEAYDFAADMHQWFVLAKAAHDGGAVPNRQALKSISYEKAMHLRGELQKVQYVSRDFNSRAVLVVTKF